MSEVSLLEQLNHEVGSLIDKIIPSNQGINQDLTIEVSSENLIEISKKLKDSSVLHFEQLIDLAGVDYQDYGVADWLTTQSSLTGFSRGVDIGVEVKEEFEETENLEGKRPLPTQFKSRFAVVYHLLSLKHNRRLRIRTYAMSDPPLIPSVIDVWAAANWYEREAFDLYGILFEGHPDLRRILTDYGFIGYPFRKDFPLIGESEVRYDAAQGRVISEKVSIPPRTLVPKTIRDDHRYLVEES